MRKKCSPYKNPVQEEQEIIIANGSSFIPFRNDD